MQSKAPGSDEAHAGSPDKRLRLIILGVAVLAVVAFAVAIFLAKQDEDKQERWDVLFSLRKKGEPNQDPIWQNPYGVYNPERMAYIHSLELFLDKRAKDSGDALEPQTRFHVAKALADHILSNPGVLDRNERDGWYAKAVEQLEAIRDRFPDFPLNWTMLSEEGFPSLTRQFIQWLQDNKAWEHEHMLRARDPAAGVRVLIRTTRGDMLMGLYSEDAPAWTAAFLERAARGFYDGTAFVSKRQIGDVTEPEEHTLRAGGDLSRDLPSFDAPAVKKASAKTVRSGTLPEESRNRIPHERGIVAAWHAPSDEYDHDAQFQIDVQRSPLLDYKYTPVGKLLDEQGVASLAVLDDLFAGETYSDDKAVRDDGEMHAVLDWFRAPVQIVKVLIYDDGKLRDAPADTLPTKAAVEDAERTLAGIQVDKYKVDRPKAPGSDTVEPKKDDEPAKQDEPAKDGDK